MNNSTYFPDKSDYLPFYNRNAKVVDLSWESFWEKSTFTKIVDILKWVWDQASKRNQVEKNNSNILNDLEKTTLFYPGCIKTSSFYKPLLNYYNSWNISKDEIMKSLKKSLIKTCNELVRNNEVEHANTHRVFFGWAILNNTFNENRLNEANIFDEFKDSDFYIKNYNDSLKWEDLLEYFFSILFENRQYFSIK